MKIFLLKRECGDYSGHTYIVGAFSTKEKAERCIQEKKNQFALNRNIHNSYKEFVRLYEKDNPYPTQSKKYKVAPKWQTGLKASEITEEMRAERNAVKEYNDQIIMEHNLTCKDYLDQRSKVALEYLTKEYPEVDQKVFVLEINHDLDCDHDDLKFHIVEIELQ